MWHATPQPPPRPLPRCSEQPSYSGPSTVGLCARQSSFNDTRKDEEDPLFVTFYSSLLRGNESWHLLRGNLWDTWLRQVVDSLVCTSLLWIGMAIKMLLLLQKKTFTALWRGEARASSSTTNCARPIMTCAKTSFSVLFSFVFCFSCSSSLSFH